MCLLIYEQANIQNCTWSFHSINPHRKNSVCVKVEGQRLRCHFTRIFHYTVSVAGNSHVHNKLSLSIIASWNLPCVLVVLKCDHQLREKVRSVYKKWLEPHIIEKTFQPYIRVTDPPNPEVITGCCNQIWIHTFLWRFKPLRSQNNELHITVSILIYNN